MSYGYVNVKWVCLAISQIYVSKHCQAGHITSVGGKTCVGLDFIQIVSLCVQQWSKSLCAWTKGIKCESVLVGQYRYSRVPWMQIGNSQHVAYWRRKHQQQQQPITKVGSQLQSAYTARTARTVVNFIVHIFNTFFQVAVPHRIAWLGAGLDGHPVQRPYAQPPYQDGIKKTLFDWLRDESESQ